MQTHLNGSTIQCSSYARINMSVQKKYYLISEMGVGLN
jgi:hypothetical protein